MKINAEQKEIWFLCVSVRELNLLDIAHQKVQEIKDLNLIVLK